MGPVGPRVTIDIKLMNKDKGYADATDGSQYELMKALTAKFAPVFAGDKDFKWVGTNDWNTVCKFPDQSFAHWKYYTDLLDTESVERAQDGRPSLIPGQTTLEFLKQAFNVPVGLVRVVELAGKDYQFSQPKDAPASEGSWVVWELGRPEGVTDFARRAFFGGQR